MTPDQVQSLRFIPANPGLRGSDLKDQSDRTLLYGYTDERLSHHVYLLNGVLHQLVYTGLRGTKDKPTLPHAIVSHRDETSVYFSGDPSMWLPNKRVYPESCDFEFCSLLARAGVDIPFTAFGVVKTGPGTDHPLPRHVDMPQIETARLSDAFHITGIERGSAAYRACYSDQGLFNRIVGRYQFADVGAEPGSWIVLEDDLDALATEINFVAAGPQALAIR